MRGIELCELQKVFIGLSCHTPAAVIFVLDQGPAICLSLRQERFVYSPPFAISNIALLFGTPIDLERRDSLFTDPKETNI